VLVQEPARALPGQAPLRPVPAAGSAGWLLAVALLIGGCAGIADVTGTASEEDATLLRSDVTALQATVRQLRTQVEGMAPKVDTRSREQGAEGDRQTAALTERVDGLSTSLASLSQRVDELSAKVEALSRQLRSAALGQPAPLSPPSAVPSPAAPPPPAEGAPPSTLARPLPPPAPGALPPGARPSTGALQPQDIYQAAYIDFSKGSYALAVTGFRDFLRRYPDHELAANAQYWIGEAQLAMARGHTDAGEGDAATTALRQALQEFRKVLANYPRSDKAPAALYKEALTLIDLKEFGTAQARLQYLVDNFPQAEEVAMARERLAALKER
jgi:tol-pal system protein YbgF